MNVFGMMLPRASSKRSSVIGPCQNLCKILDKLGRHDGLDLSNLAGVELLYRRCQLIEYFHNEKGPGGGKGSGRGKDRKAYDGSYKAEAAIFTGMHRESGDSMVAPDLPDSS